MCGRTILLVAIDANVLDRDGTARDASIDRFRSTAEAGHLRILLPSGVLAELGHPHTPAEVKAAADAAGVTGPAGSDEGRSFRGPTARQHIDRIRVRAILRGDGRPGKHDADAAHLSEAAEAGCRYFITRDGKILRKRDILRGALPPDLRVATLEEFLSGMDEDAWPLHR